MSSPVIARDETFHLRLNTAISETITEVLTEETDDLDLPPCTWELTDDNHFVGSPVPGISAASAVEAYAHTLGYGFTHWAGDGLAADVRIAGRWVQVRERAS